MSCDKSLIKNIDSKTRALVVGAGRSGLAAVRLLAALGANVKLAERKLENIPLNFIQFANSNNIQILNGEHSPEQFMDLDLVVLSPAVPLSKVLPLVDKNNIPEIISETELAYRQLRADEDKIPLICITGTSGKTTTTSLCAAMLEEQGYKVFMGGNIGIPLSEFVLSKKDVDAIVLELSSFQLQTSYSLRPRVALLLNISENHLDFHADMKEYVDAKMRLFRCQDSSDLAIFGTSLRGLATLYGVKSRQVYFEPSGRFTQMQLFGKHNESNAEAAYLAVKELGVSLENAQKAVHNFKAIDNRLELVANKNGVVYVNDSKCTTVEALKVALEAFEQPICLLAGGKFKGGDLASLNELVKSKVKIVALYGDSREQFEKAWSGLRPIIYNPTLSGAIQYCANEAVSGDVVLLAPACSSYDQYDNYLQRGEDFRNKVKSL